MLATKGNRIHTYRVEMRKLDPYGLILQIGGPHIFRPDQLLQAILPSRLIAEVKAFALILTSLANIENNPFGYTRLEFSFS